MYSAEFAKQMRKQAAHRLNLSDSVLRRLLHPKIENTNQNKENDMTETKNMIAEAEALSGGQLEKNAAA